MRILYVIGSMELGGAERHLLSVCAGLKARGHNPMVFSIITGGPLTAAFESAGVPVLGIRLPAWVDRLIPHPRARAWVGVLLSAAVLWVHLWRLRPAVLHFFLPMAYLMGGMVSFFGPPALRIMSRRSLNHYQAAHSRLARLERRLHRRMDLICGNSQAVIADLRAEGVQENQLRLIYNGVDLSRFENPPRSREAVRQEIGAPVDALVFVIVANLIPYKGHADLVEAFGIIRDRLPQGWECWCIGRDDGIVAGLQLKARRLGIDAHIRFLGSRYDVPDLLNASDIGVLCSHEEGFSNAVLEGMAVSLPMVVTDVGGNAEAVTDGATGRVVPPRSPDALAGALLAVAEDADRATMGRRGQDQVRTVFSINACLDAYEALYREGGG